MISSISSPADGRHSWRISDFEHEVRLADGSIADLKADYGVDYACLDTTTLWVRMSSETDGTSVVLSWRDVSELSVATTGPRIPAEDGRIGLIGLRLLRIAASALDFEIEMDWLRYRLACQSFEVVSDRTA